MRAFTDRQIELVTNFANQAVIAIENVRLFDEIQDKNRQLQQASEHKSQFVSSVSHELRTPLFNAIIGLTEDARAPFPESPGRCPSPTPRSPPPRPRAGR